MPLSASITMVYSASFSQTSASYTTPSFQRLSSVREFKQAGRELSNCLRSSPEYALEAGESPVYVLRQNDTAVAAVRFDYENDWRIAEVLGVDNVPATPREVSAAMKLLSTLKEPA